MMWIDMLMWEVHYENRDQRKQIGFVYEHNQPALLVPGEACQGVTSTHVLSGTGPTVCFSTSMGTIIKSRAKYAIPPLNQIT